MSFLRSTIIISFFSAISISDKCANYYDPMVNNHGCEGKDCCESFNKCCWVNNECYFGDDCNCFVFGELCTTNNINNNINNGQSLQECCNAIPSCCYIESKCRSGDVCSNNNDRICYCRNDEYLEYNNKNETYSNSESSSTNHRGTIKKKSTKNKASHSTKNHHTNNNKDTKKDNQTKNKNKNNKNKNKNKKNKSLKKESITSQTKIQKSHKSGTKSTKKISNNKSNKSNNHKNKNNVNHGYGDCNCDKKYGMTYLRMMYFGKEDVNQINFYYDKNKQIKICSFDSIITMDEIECDILNNQQLNEYKKFNTNTYFEIIYVDNNLNKKNCFGSFHTSCSKDIIGSFGDGECNKDLLVTGWMDGNPNHNECNNGFEQCLSENNNNNNQNNNNNCAMMECEDYPSNDPELCWMNGCCFDYDLQQCKTDEICADNYHPNNNNNNIIIN